MKLLRLAVVALVLSAAVLLSPGCETREATADLRDSAIAERDKIDKTKTDLEATAATIEKALAPLRAKIEELEAQRDWLRENLEDAHADASTAAALAAERDAVLRKISESRSSLEASEKAIADARASISAATAKSAELSTAISAADAALKATDANAPNPGATIGALAGTFWPGVGTAATIVLGAAWNSWRLSGANSKLRSTLQTKQTAQDRIVASIEALSKIAPEVATAIREHAEVLDQIQGPEGKTAVDESQTRNSAKLKIAA